MKPQIQTTMSDYKVHCVICGKRNRFLTLKMQGNSFPVCSNDCELKAYKKIEKLNARLLMRRTKQKKKALVYLKKRIDFLEKEIKLINQELSSLKGTKGHIVAKRYLEKARKDMLLIKTLNRKRIYAYKRFLLRE